jgi:predicted DNA-binding transcriptional regulator AlpA
MRPAADADTSMSEQPEYIGKSEAAQRLKISERTVLGLAAKGKIRSKKQLDPDSRNQMVTLLNAADVERYGFERDNPQQVEPVKNGLDVTPRGLTRQAILQVYKDRFLDDDNPQPGPIGRDASPWLNLEQSAAYTGLPEPVIDRLIEAGRIPVIDTWPKDRKGGGLPGGRYRINRRDLDALEGVRL